MSGVSPNPLTFEEIDVELVAAVAPKPIGFRNGSLVYYNFGNADPVRGGPFDESYEFAESYDEIEYWPHIDIEAAQIQKLDDLARADQIKDLKPYDIMSWWSYASPEQRNELLGFAENWTDDPYTGTFVTYPNQIACST